MGGEKAGRWAIAALVPLLFGAILIGMAFVLRDLNPEYVKLLGEQAKQTELALQGQPHHPVDLDSVEKYRPVRQSPMFLLGGVAVAVGVWQLARSLRVERTQADPKA